MSFTSPARPRARLVAFVVSLAATGVALSCAPAPRSNGEGCIKDEDCLSGVCAGLTCAAAPPLIDAQVQGPGVDASPAKDGAVDAPADGTSDDGDDASDAPTEGSSDAPAGDGMSDASGEAGDSGRSKDAGADAKRD